MCGICGIVSLCNKPIELSQINRLNSYHAHRGPDGEGVFFSQNNLLALGHRRLSILDLTEKGKQPMSYMENRYHITMNGEIYNFIEIKEILQKKNYQFTNDSDTEVVLASYHEWGEKMLERFNGMWAFAIYDSYKNSLFLSRDRYGIKPLYYYKTEEVLIFTSEVQGIHKYLGNKHPLDELVLKEISKGSFLNHGSTRTYLKNVNSLSSGYNLLLKNNKIEFNQWYKLKKKNIPKTFTNQKEKLKELIVDACKIRLRSDVPIGTCLSGGVDSSSITAIINQFNLENEKRFNNFTHRSFNASFPYSVIDERENAEKLASNLGIKLDVVPINSPNKEELEKAMLACDGPMHSLAFYPIWSLYKYIKESGISVTLDGQGPDEMLGGYRPLKEALYTAIKFRNPFWFYDVYKTYAAQGETAQFSARKNASVVLKQVILPYLKMPFRLAKKLLSSSNNISSPIIEKSEKLNQVNNDRIIFNNPLDESLYEQFFISPLPGILNQYDRCSMAFAVECRMPFMDYRIVEFIFSLPPSAKIGNGYTKRILREAMKDILPDNIRLNKIKIGFNAPIVEWFKGDLKEFMNEIMNKPEFLNSAFFNGIEIKEKYDQFLKTDNPQWDIAWQFWPPVHLTWWLIYNKIEL